MREASQESYWCLSGGAGVPRPTTLDSELSGQPALPLPRGLVWPRLLCHPFQKGLGVKALCAFLITAPSRGG